MWISVQSANQCSRQMCKKRAWVRDILFRRDNSATVCSHSFQPLNQSVRIPTWSRNIMACLLGKENRNAWMGLYSKDCSLRQRQTQSHPRTAGLYLQQSWDPLRLDRGALTWFRSKGNCRSVCWVDDRDNIFWVYARGSVSTVLCKNPSSKTCFTLACSESHHPYPMKKSKQ